METIKQLIMDNLGNTAIIATALTAVLGLLIKWIPKWVLTTNGLLGETGELLLCVAHAAKDGKLTKEELDQIIKEAKDVGHLVVKAKDKALEK